MATRKSLMKKQSAKYKADRIKKPIDPKWLRRGTPLSLSNTDTISNGAM